MKEYDEDLAKFPWKVIANKMDLEGAEENLVAFRARFPRVDIIAISAEKEEGLDDLKVMLDGEISQRP